MNGQLKNILDKIKGFFQGMSPKLRKILVVGLVAAVVFSIAVAIVLNNKPYDTLFTGLNSQEASEVIGKLQESAVDYKYENDGTILVPKDQVSQLKAQLVYEGYPKSGFTYNVFKENISLTSTDFEKSSYKLFDLQERIKSTIECFAGVKEAIVTISPGEDRKYVLDSNNVVDASASVVVIMKDGGSPTEDQVRGIQRLVSMSIPQVTFDSVVVVDGNGIDVTVSDENSTTGSSRTKLELERAIEDTIKAKVLNVLNPIYGAENVRVSVRSSVDIDKKISELINYTPQTDDNKGIPSTETSKQEMVKGGEGAGGIPGTETNADVTTYAQINPDGTETYYNNEGTVDYLVNQLKQQIESNSGDIKDVTVSVAINGTDLGNVNLADMQALIGNAAGIAPEVQTDKITVVCAPFYNNSDLISQITNNGIDQRTLLIVGIASGVAVLLLLILLIVLILRGRKKKKAKKAGEQDPNANATVPPISEPEANNLALDLLNIKNEQGLELKTQIRDFTDQNPEISAQLLKQWLRGGEDDGQ